MSHHTSDDSGPDNAGGRRSSHGGTLPSWDTLVRAARWETLAILLLLFVLAFFFA
ncbi:hypothetical protein [Streptomyces sp. N2A]|uniref:hypothetical protein n=1 Tax=Streptomyces sp. N2A TaxID=3073936 RepID=UPI002870AFE6|nr:hypothetical protein [Streptomyces sp. N2A]